MVGPPPGFLKDHLEVSQGSERVCWILMIVTDFQNSAENGMFGHPARDTFDLVTPSCRSLFYDSYCDVITRYGPFSKVVRNMKITVKPSRLGHRQINKCSVNSG